jgi:hypothetical protein
MGKSNPTSDKKLLPSGAPKQLIRELYIKNNQSELTKVMHRVCIKQNPHYSIKFAKGKQDLTQKELSLVVEEIGPPAGYLEEFE